MNYTKDSNYCFDSLVIRLWSEDLKTPSPKNWTTRITGLVLMTQSTYEEDRSISGKTGYLMEFKFLTSVLIPSGSLGRRTEMLASTRRAPSSIWHEQVPKAYKGEKEIEEKLSTQRKYSWVGRHSIVDKASAYGAKGPGFKTRWRQYFIK